MTDKKMDVEVKNGYKSFDATTLFESGLIHLMNDYNLTWEAVYNIILENIEIDYERLVYEDGGEILDTRSFLESKEWKQYCKKPVVIKAYQTDRELKIATLEGDMIANKGDYVIEGVKGELYPCKPDVFKETYEEVQE